MQFYTPIIPATYEAEAREQQVQDHPHQLSETLFQNNKKKEIKRAGDKAQ